MKRILLLATMFATVLSLSAQRNMQVWEDGSYSEFPTNNVDSITFLLSPNGTPRTYVTPQFKIESDYWYVSYDEGWTWTQLGEATGEQGAQGPQGEKGDTGEKGEKGDTGAQGPKGDKGDPMFLSVTQDDNYIYLLMTDSTKIQIAKANKSSKDFDKTVIDNLVNSLTISKNTILLRTIGQKDTIVSTTAPFLDSKVVWTSSDESIASVIDGRIEALQEGYVTITARAATLSQQCKVYVVLERDSGFSVSDTSQVLFSPGNLQYNTAQKIWRFAKHQYDFYWKFSTDQGSWIDLFQWGICTNTSTGARKFIEWGENSIDSYDPNVWRTLKSIEWEYIFRTRPNASILYGSATVAGNFGIILLPDNWKPLPRISVNIGMSGWENNTFTVEEWTYLEYAGAVFLPCIFYQDSDWKGMYWSSTAYKEDRYINCLKFESSSLIPSTKSAMGGTYLGANTYQVRLVQDVKQSTNAKTTIMPIQNVISQQVGTYTNNVQNTLFNNARKHLPTAIQDQWEQTVAGLVIDAEHDSFDDIYQKVENARIRGVGTKTLIETAAKICYDNDICPDDNCWYMCINKTPREQHLIIELERNERFLHLTTLLKIEFLLIFGKVLLNELQTSSANRIHRLPITGSRCCFYIILGFRKQV